MKLWCAVFLLLCSVDIVLAERAFYVSTDGDDAWSGTLAEPNASKSDGPFASIEHARDVLQTLSSSGDITVYIREGFYFLDQTLTFGPEHSGRSDTRITYKNYNNEDVTISGGFEITGWQQQGQLLVTTINDVKNGDLYFKELYVNEERRDRARHPNKGDFFRIHGSLPGQEKSSFYFHPGDMDAYDNLDDVNIVFYQSWLGVHLWIDRLDAAQNVVEFSPQMWWETGHFDNRARYYVENAYELLDEPGEWYLNRTTGQLYYYPMPGETLENILVIAPKTDRVIELAGQPNENNYVEYLTFSGLKIKHADWMPLNKSKTEGQAHIQLDDAIIYARGAYDCHFIDCEISLGGAHGFIFTSGSSNNLVQKCHIHALGGGGLYLGDTSGWNACSTPAPSDEIADNTIDNCFIHDLTHVHHGSVGIWVGCSSNNTITYNEICDMDYTGISVGWCWGYKSSFQQNNVINNNHIHHLGNGELSDMGGVYTLGESDGTVVSNNLIHDVYAYAYGGWGLYTDEGTTDIVMENNIVYNVKSQAFHQHYGQDNFIRNNILAFSHEAGIARTRDEAGNSFNFTNNIVLTDIGVQLGGSWGDGNFTMNNNLYWDIMSHDRLDFDLGTFNEWQAKGHDTNSQVADPLFVGAENFDFTLQAGSPALDLGFQPIDVSAIGLYGESDWTTLPDLYERRTIYPGAWFPKTPFFNMTEFVDDFEDTDIGAYPKYSYIWGITGNSTQSIYITNLKAQSGSHSMRIDDKPLSVNSYEPFLRYFPYWFQDGVVTVEFDMYMEAGTSLTHEWRDNQGYPQNRGVSIDLKPDNLWKDGDISVRIPTDGWFHLKIECPVGGLADGRFDVTITVDGVSVTKDRALINKTWQRFYEAYFISTTNIDASIYIDNMRFAYDLATSVKQLGKENLVMDFHLEPNFPNPFNPTTTISYVVADADKKVKLAIYNSTGQRVKLLGNRRYNVGRHTIQWDGRDENGHPLASGVYLLRMSVEDSDEQWLHKLMLMK